MFGCIREAEGGVIIYLHVVPGSKSRGFSYEPWEKRLRVRVSSPAVKGKANKEVVAIFSRMFGNSELVSGLNSRKKSLLIRDKNLSAVEELLISVLY